MEEAIVVHWFDDDGTVGDTDEVESVEAALSLIDRRSLSIAGESLFCAPGRWKDYPEDEPDGRERKRVWADERAKDEGCEPVAEIIRFK